MRRLQEDLELFVREIKRLGGKNMEQLKNIIPEPFIQDFLKNEKKAIQLSFVDEGLLDLKTSKAGGRGYLPKSVNYPVNKKGMPLSLLAQINFEEMPFLENFPQQGLLAFYVDMYDDLIGLDFKNQKNTDGFRVLYFAELNEISYTREEQDALFTVFEKEELYKIVSDEFKMTGQIESRVIISNSYDFFKAYGKNAYEFYEDAFLEKADDIMDAIYEHIPVAGSLIGGYPFFTQEDPRQYEKHVTETELLFQLDTEKIGDGEIMWGDSGIGNFFISKEDLKKKDFSRVLYNWDCY